MKSNRKGKKVYTKKLSQMIKYKKYVMKYKNYTFVKF